MAILGTNNMESHKQVYEQDANLLDFVELLQKIDSTSRTARLNVTSIPNNNGGRIEL